MHLGFVRRPRLLLMLLATALVVTPPRPSAARPVVPPIAVLRVDTTGRIPVSTGIPDVAAAIRCPDQRFVQNLADGPVWVVVRPRPDNRCAIWLGGASGNPKYSGLPVTYCELTKASKKLVIVIGPAGGPARATHPDCVPTGFAQST